ncbi:type VI secretion system baseplate subunit TssK [Pseudomonas citronellolis]|uniref:type VI secretion system baseplate subunit TssK n=1 Tax=Pseudomonas citronellolis TaxID=53408 RepID=UPI0023E413A0|nr:type VI secretion system baseplate subunit TssK [Pseudomonas citronellolis]MDF3933909.1 type VI secretion system baseplate subunit TssK [Pseudomonas citronellolis]
MKIDRPLWGAGTLLSPQQFQQQALWEAWTNECLAHLSVVHPWGVQSVALDLDALRLGKIKATTIKARLQDGTLIDSERTDPLPPAIELATLKVGNASQLTVLLALPLSQANGGNCLLDDAKPSRPTRYRRRWGEVQDLYGNESQSIAVLEHALTLRLDSDENAEYLTCPIARIERDAQGVWSVDAHYIPPLLRFDAHSGLTGLLNNLLTQLSAKRSRLMGMRRESNQRMADFAVADVSLFWLLNALNTQQPVLAELTSRPARHPEQVYLELAKLAGSLLTFSLEHDIAAVPAYRHDRLGDVFPPLFSLISTLLEASLPSRMIALDLLAVSANRWQADLHDARLRDRDAVDFYLSVRSSLPAAQLQSQLPRLCKVGAPDDVDRLVNAALDGVALLPLSQVPAAIPMRLGNQYFALDLGDDKAQAMLDAGVCALYLPGTLADVKLDLFAVLRS